MYEIKEKGLKISLFSEHIAISYSLPIRKELGVVLAHANHPAVFKGKTCYFISGVVAYKYGEIGNLHLKVLDHKCNMERLKIELMEQYEQQMKDNWFYNIL